VTVENIGNAALSISVPASGNNPSISDNFSLNSSGTSACPLISSGASGPGTLAAGAFCYLPISFTPTEAGTFNGSLVLTDNALNTTLAQTIQLSGTGTGSTAQTITFGSIPTQTASTTLALSATASSGLTVSLASTTTGVCTVSGATASLVAAGTCSIVATQPGDSTYAAATPVTQSFTVILAGQTITFGSIPNQVVNTSVGIPLTATASSDLPVSFSSTTPSVCTVSGSTASLIAAGTCTIQAAQPGDGVAFAAAPSTTQTFTGETVNPLTGTGFGMVNIGATNSAVAVSVTISTAGTLGTISVLTQGVTSLDFASTTGGSCSAGNSYNVGDNCTVNVTFTPSLSGTRYGAVVLQDSSGNILATAYTDGIGVGPQLTFQPGNEGSVPNSAQSPEGIAVDSGGNLYIVDTTGSQILKETLSENSYTESTIPVNDGLYSPTSVAIDGSGAVYIADTGDNRVVVEAPAGAGYAETVVPTSALSGPEGVAVDGNGNVYIADTGNNRVLLESLSNGTYNESTVPTSPLNSPSAVAVDGTGNVYILDTSNNRVLIETLSNGGYSESTAPTSSLNGPSTLTVDTRGDIYIADAGNNRVLEEVPSASGYVERLVPTSALMLPYGVVADANGNVYVADTYNDRVLKEDFADPPRLAFLPTAPNTTSADSPQAVMVQNIGNAGLSISVPASGNNPSVSDPFSLNSSGTSACPLVSPGASGPGTLPAGASCSLDISFTPTATGTFTGSLVLSDNALNAMSTQTIQLSGTGTGSTAQTITFGSIPAQSANTTLALSATASSDLTVSFVSTTPGVCTVSGTTASLVTAGTCSIVATQPGDSTYAAATPVTQTFTVNLSSQTITFLSIPNQVENQSVGIELAAGSSSGLPVSFVSATPAVCTVSGATASLLSTGTCSIQASQGGDGIVYGPAPNVAESFTVETVNPLTGTGFGSVSIGSTSSAIPVTMTIGTVGTLGSMLALTSGSTGLDFAAVAGGTCTTGSSYNAGDSCTVSVTFSPVLAGNRYGAIELLDGSGNVMSTAFIQGDGIGPQVTFLPGMESTITTDVSGPGGIAVDGAGDLYIADTYNNRVLKETLSNGVYSESTLSTSSLSSPAAVALDGSGSLYVLDSGNSRVLKETPESGGYVETTVPTSALNYPGGLTVDASGNLYIADTGNNRVLMESLSNGAYTETTIPTSSLSIPNGVTVDSHGDVYIADSGNNRVLRENLSSGAYNETTVSTSPLNYPVQVALDSTNNIYIVDPDNYRVLKETVSGSSYAESVVTTSSLSWPYGVTIDGAGNIYIGDSGGNRVLKEDLSDPPSLSFASTAPGTTSSDSPQTVILDNSGNATLTFPVPASGSNPSISDNFTLDSSVTSACPLVSSGASSPGTLAAGQSCALPVSFSPSSTGTFTGSLVIGDNALNATSTQAIQLSGTGSDSQMSSMSPHSAKPLDQACPLPPVMTNIYPATWFAGKTYHVTVTGANFISAAVTCAGGDYTYNPTTISITSAKNTVIVLSEQVLSSSVLLATIQVGEAEPTAPAHVSIMDPTIFGSPIRHALTSVPVISSDGTMATVQILGTPQIRWNDNTVTFADCTLTQNATLSGNASSCAVVGQRIKLTTDVANDSTIQITKNVWSVSPQAITGYNPTPGATTATPFTPASEDKAVQFYWVYPGGASASYSYCITIPGIDGSDLAPPDLANCSEPATATFTIKGIADASITVATRQPQISYLPGCQHSYLRLSLGDLMGTCHDFSANGIEFTPNGTAPSGAIGAFLFVQTSNGGEVVYSYSGETSSCTVPISIGLDGEFPYPTDEDGNAFDGPGTPLWSDYQTTSMTYNATMWLMWQDQENMGQSGMTIPVPLGFVNWSFNGVATQSSSGQWTATGSGGPMSNDAGSVFIQSGPDQVNYGYPAWHSLLQAHSVCSPYFVQ